MKPLILSATLLLISAINLCWGQPYYFSRYQVENGLSNNGVICSVQDNEGFMWFGTKDGLNRFDGYTFKIFRNDPEDDKSLGSNFIRSLAIDKEGMLWVGTARGLYQYNSITESFSQLSYFSTNEITDIEFDREGNIWFISEGTLTKYNRRTGKLRIYKNSEFFNATSICITDEGVLWISTGQGAIHKFIPSTDSFIRYDLFAKSPPTVSRWIEKLFFTGDGSLLVGTSNQGVKSFDIKTSTYQDILTYNSDKTAIFARDFIKQSENEIWIASESGIFIYNTITGKIINIQKQYNSPYSISDNAVYTFCKDKEGGIWAGTYFGGVNYYPKQYTQFEKFFPRMGVNSISGNAVREITTDKYNNIWIGTEDAGLNKLHSAKGIFTSFKPSGKITDVSNTNIHGLLATGDTLWIGTFEHGLDVLNIKTGKVMNHYFAGEGPNSFKSNFIHYILRSRSGELFFCTPRGLYQYDWKNKNFILIKEVPDYIFYTTMLEDSSGTLWLGTYREGLFYYNPKTKRKGYYVHQKGNSESLSNNRVNGIFEDSYGNMWFATEGGLCKLDQKRQAFKRYTVKDEFPSDVIFSILEDEKKLLWISTSKGLVWFNPRTEKLKVFTKANGLLSDQFNYNSAFKDSMGQMYFGSVNGLIRFNPSKFIKNTFTPPIYITGFQVYNKELIINKKHSPLKKAVRFTNKITLKYNQSSFSIDFAALSYTSPNMTEYAYVMEGLDKDWTYLKTNRKAYFTELPPGEYIFKVKASNSSGTWNEKGAELVIEILPPFWASNWAYFLYLVSLASVLYLGIKFYHNKIKEKNKRKLEFLEHEKEKEIYQAKIEFFTNVAHEIRTPLTLIKGPMEKLIKRAVEIPNIQNNLKIMEKNTDRLLNLTNQLLDFRKTETKGFSLNFVKTNICELVKEIYIRFKPAAEQKRIKFKIVLPSPVIYVYVDPEALNKILSNLIGNAVKYAESKVCVCLLSVDETQKTFTILVKNDGFLIPSEMREKIFETFFRMKETEKQPGTGMGLSLSRSLAELHKGTISLIDPEEGFNVFALTLPIHQEIEFNPIMSN